MKFLLVVHPAGFVLAAGAGGAGALSAGVAVAAAVPDGGNRGGRRARPGLGDRDAARARHAGPVGHVSWLIVEG